MKSAKAITRKKTAGKRTNNGASGGRAETSPSQLVDTKIRTLGGWRGETLAHMRALIKEADPEVVEEIKWRKPSNPHGVPVWEHDGIVCTGETSRDKVKLTFARGASLKDPARLFNAGLDGNMRRAIDIAEGEKIDGTAFKVLFRQAVALNRSKRSSAAVALPRKKSKGA